MITIMIDCDKVDIKTQKESTEEVRLMEDMDEPNDICLSVDGLEYYFNKKDLLLVVKALCG